MPNLWLLLLVGIGATLAMDIWGVIRQLLLGIPFTNYGLVGRWMAYMPRGRFYHKDMSTLPAVAGEQILGWLAHYLIGVAYAALLISIVGWEWLQQPTLGPALVIGITTLVVPLFVMQPAMGAGFAASRTPRPIYSCLHSFINHAVFGVGLYVAGCAIYFLGS